MKNTIVPFLESAITAVLLVVVGLTPLLFFNQTTEFFEIPKLIFLVMSVLFLYILWSLSWITRGKITITRTPFDIPLLMLLVVIILSAVFSGSKFPALYGNFPKVHGSVIAWTTYILLYFVAVSHIKTVFQIKAYLYLLYASSILVAVVTCLSFFDILMPIDVVTSINFTPTGSAFSTIALMLLLLPLPIYSLINPNTVFPIPVSIVLTIMLGMTVALISPIVIVAVMLLVFAACFFVSKPEQIKRTVGYFLIPVAVTGLILVLVHMPPPGNFDTLQLLHKQYPQEVQLPITISWKVAVSALRDNPFIGSGPSTFLFNFTNFKPIEFNQLPYWNIAFDTAYNEFLYILGTLGVLGFVAFIFLIVAILNTGRTSLIASHGEHHGKNIHLLLPALVISSITSVILFLIHASTLVSFVTTIFILAFLIAARRISQNDGAEYVIGFRTNTTGKRYFDPLPYVLFVLIVGGVILVAWKMPNIVMADYYHRQALLHANKNAKLTYDYLQKAESLNPHIDVYRVDMAQTNFAIANALAAQLNNSEASAAGTLSDRETIQTLISQAINEGKASTVLSPRSARNWEVLAAIYRSITGVAENAMTFSLDAYGRAIQLDPFNPALRLNVGIIYYSMKNYDQAIRFFSDAINLKPDYASAYYHLALTLRDKQDLANAKVVAEQAIKLLPKNTQDYVQATKLLRELESGIASGSANTSTAPDSNTSLEELNIPEIDLDKDDNSPTPAPVESNPDVELPDITPTGSPDANTQ